MRSADVEAAARRLGEPLGPAEAVLLGLLVDGAGGDLARARADAEALAAQSETVSGALSATLKGGA